MTKNEIKNRISMALKDPVLQQGFEIICKENAELKHQLENVELRLLKKWCLSNDPCPHLKKRDEQLAKAKEIIRVYMLYCKGETHKYKEAEKQAEQFLSELKKNERGIF